MHDPNSTSQRCECINGHRFRVQTFVRCPHCDLGHGDPITIMLAPRRRFDPRTA